MIGLSLLRVIFKYISVQTYFSFRLIQTLVRKSNLPNDSHLQSLVCKLWDHVLLGLTACLVSSSFRWTRRYISHMMHGIYREQAQNLKDRVQNLIRS